MEPAVWGLISDLLKDPDLLRTGLERMIEEERRGWRGGPEREAKAWLEKLTEANRQRKRAQDLAIQGLLDYGELRAKLAALTRPARRPRRSWKHYAADAREWWDWKGTATLSYVLTSA